MPEKPLTVATYAAGASLAAITLIYVFAPTYFLDTETPASGNGFLSSRKKGVVGLSNPANDCFINSVLQALAGLGDLRLYLIRETHRRSVEDSWVYAEAVPVEAWDSSRDIAGGSGRASMPAWKVEGLQSGIVTRGLKEILDALNERPIYRKIITAVPFVRVLESAFRQRISRQQQDAQEFLQVVAERLCDEYHAGRRARLFARRKAMATPVPTTMEVEVREGNDAQDNGMALPIPGQADSQSYEDEEDGEDGFPLEGRFESQIECLTCGFKPRPTESTFCTLTLNVPQASSTTLNACFDGMFKTEHIDDFKCEKCRLLHAIALFEDEIRKSNSASFKAKTEANIAILRAAIDIDPEKLPDDVELPDLRHAPKRRIARHIRLTGFPKIMAIHLSRSIFDSNLSLKNSAKVAFPERLPLGGLLEQKKYKLLGLVTHKGSHHSGHYESFRRQNVYPPFSNPSTFQPSGIYSKTASPASTPRIDALRLRSGDSSPLASTPDLLSPASGNNSSTPSLDSTIATAPGHRSSPSSIEPPTSALRLASTSAAREKDHDSGALRSAAASARTTISRIASRPSSRSESQNGTSGRLPRVATPGSEKDVPQVLAVGGVRPKRKKAHDKWWRISDEKVKEASTRDVLGMQKEVYLLFYELERE